MADIGQGRADVVREDGQSISAVGDRSRHTQKYHHGHRNHRAAPRHHVDKAARESREDQHPDFPQSEIHNQSRGVRMVTNSSAAVG